jgi:hypothetical protein
LAPEARSGDEHEDRHDEVAALLDDPDRERRQ